MPEKPETPFNMRSCGPLIRLSVYDRLRGTSPVLLIKNLKAPNPKP